MIHLRQKYFRDTQVVAITPDAFNSKEKAGKGSKALTPKHIVLNGSESECAFFFFTTSENTLFSD